MLPRLATRGEGELMSDCQLYALLSNYSEAAAWPPPNSPQPTPVAAIEIVDLASLRRVDFFEIGARKPTGLELVGRDLYVVDPSHNEVVVIAVAPPARTLSVSPAPSDCEAAPDGSRVYVAGSQAIDVIDTTSLLVQSVPFQPPFAASGVAISDDGGTVVAVGERAGTGVAVVLDTAARSVRQVDLAGTNTALDAAFIKNNLAVVLTGSSFMQVDTSSATQVPGATVPTGVRGSARRSASARCSSARPRLARWRSTTPRLRSSVLSQCRSATLSPSM